MKQIFPNNFNNQRRSKTPFMIRNGYSTFNNFSKNKFEFNSSLFDMMDIDKESNFTSYYKELFLNQVNIKLDERVYDLISKMDNIKQYNEAKEQYDEAKRLLIKEVINDKFKGNLKNNKNANRINLKNYTQKINHNYSHDEKDNQLMFSLFDKLKTRKKKVYKFKIKNHLEKLYQGNMAVYKKRQEQIFQVKKKPEKKFDMKLLIQSNFDIEEYINKNKKKKVMFDDNKSPKKNDENGDNGIDIGNDKDSKNNEFKRAEKKKRTFLDKKSNIKDYFNNLNLLNNKSGRKSFVGSVVDFNSSNMNSLQKGKNDSKYRKRQNSSLNLPNIKDKDIDKLKFNSSKSSKTLKRSTKDKNKIKDNLSTKNLIDIKTSQDFKKNKKNNIQDSNNKLINDINTDNNKNKISNTNIQLNLKVQNIDDNKDIKSKKSNKNNIINSINDNKDIYQKINLTHKKTVKTRNKDNIRNIKNNIFISDTANEILSELNDKEKELTKSTTKISKSLRYFKNTSDNFYTMKSNKSSNFLYKYFKKPFKSNKKILTINTIKKSGIMFQHINENNSQFHFPIINRLLYKDKKGKIDMIDRIKFNLKNEYIEKLKERKINRKIEINGKNILNKLNDQYHLEKLLEMADFIKEQRRKEDNYEI